VAAALTMYTTTWCAFCKRLKGQLAKAGIEIAEVNIEEDPAAADYVMSVNGGFQTVPTVVFSDGSALTNPSAAAVSQRLAKLAGTDEPAGRDSAQPAVAQPEVAQQ
jgi:mycoredoxin